MLNDSREDSVYFTLHINFAKVYRKGICKIGVQIPIKLVNNLWAVRFGISEGEKEFRTSEKWDEIMFGKFFKVYCGFREERP